MCHSHGVSIQEVVLENMRLKCTGMQFLICTRLQYEFVAMIYLIKDYRYVKIEYIAPELNEVSISKMNSTMLQSDCK